MLAKNPLELVPKKLSKDEIVEALRLAIIAELDAINLYMQLARSINDERIKKVFEDIAGEEKTHVGEFLALLKMLDEEQVKELEKGEREVKELIGK
ncbi:MAG: rubrerythrin [Thermoprotei archaeon]|nr:MAG: rubrerythrin [Thermoprotei archaeon]